MLPKRKRVNKELFQNVLQKGEVFHSSFFIFRYIRQKTPQYAFVVPKTVAKSAVLRNKLRRLGYNSLNLTQIPPLAAIFFYKKQAQKISQNQIKDDILSLLKKIK